MRARAMVDYGGMQVHVSVYSVHCEYSTPPVVGCLSAGALAAAVSRRPLLGRGHPRPTAEAEPHKYLPAKSSVLVLHLDRRGP